MHAVDTETLGRPGAARRVAARAALVVATVAAVAIAGSSPALASGHGGDGLPVARAAQPLPQTPVAFPKTLEPLPRFEPTVVCDPAPKPGTVALRSLVLSTYPTSRDLGISRACSARNPSDHTEGRAWDWGVRADDPTESAEAWTFLNWLTAADAQGRPAAMARRLGVMYLIFDDHIWRGYEPQLGWQPYLNDGCVALSSCSETLRHRDHVHISLTRAGGMGTTSFWTGDVVKRDGSQVEPAAVPHTPKVPTGLSATGPLARFAAQPLLPGTTGPAVTALQKALRTVPVTGTYDSTTSRAVVELRQVHGWGRWPAAGPRVWAALDFRLRYWSTWVGDVDSARLRRGSSGSAVLVLERALRMRRPDSHLGASTVRLVRRLQRSHGLAVDGVVGRRTWDVLRGL